MVYSTIMVDELPEPPVIILPPVCEAGDPECYMCE